jgi:hypothetical protein
VAAWEIIAFRLALVVAVLTLIFAGGAAMRYRKDEAFWAAQVRQIYPSLREAQAACWDDSTDTFCDAGLVQSFSDQFNSAAESRFSLRDRSEMLFSLAWKVPLGAMAAFYVLRWIVLGRLTPVWPLRRRFEVPAHPHP